MASVSDHTTAVPKQALSSKLRDRFAAHSAMMAAVVLLLCLLVLIGHLSMSAALASIALLLVFAFVYPSVAPRDTVADSKITPDDDQFTTVAATMAERHTAEIQDLIYAIPSPVALIDARADIMAASALFAELFPENPVGTSALVRFRSPEVHDAIRTATRDRQTARAEFADKGRVGRWFEVSVVPLAGALGRAGGCVLYLHDLSDARRLEKMRTDFVGNASHELRTPLTSLKGYLETLTGAARNDPAARERFIGIMLEQADRMERLIDDLLSLSRFETGMGRATFGPIELSDTLFHVRSALVPMAEKYGIELEFDDEALLADRYVVYGSRDELIQLFENLVENAIKYGDQETSVHVTLTSAREFGRDVCKVTVTDTGPGIAPEHIPRLTERFYRVDVQTSRERQGTGLGLAIVKHILTRHDGYLSVRSVLGEGSAFTVTIPRVALK